MGNSDDEFAEYGTSLEPIEEDDAAKKKPIHVSEQIATDEKGRRRFHGAFTGGFSAGYFNTVGSKEGWTPSTFKSSRKDRGSFKNQNVMDFMDDEDKGAFGIAPQVLRPTDDFTDKNDSRGRKRPWAQQQSEGPIPGMPALDQILQPVKETVGIKILIRMGWRPGKGVGPKIDKREKIKKPKLSSLRRADETREKSDTEGEARRIYGCSLPPPEFMQTDSEGSSDVDEDIEEAKALLAPDDVNALLCNPKENTFGLGYKGLDRNTLTPATAHTDLFGSKLKFRVENKNLSISGQAFGVGAFEENDDDIYAREDMSQYDFALETPEERKKRKAGEEKEKGKKKNKENCIDGFRVSTSNGVRRKFYAPPHLPPNFEPIHKTKQSRFETSEDTSDKQDALSKGLARHSLTISERQVLIEDDANKLPPLSKPEERKTEEPQETPESQTDEKQQPPPVVDKDDIKRRIERLKKFTQILQAYSSQTPEQNEKAAFKPFMKNPEKQERYEKYLTLRDAGFTECLKDLQPVGMTEWERDREKMEFERASKLYKPMNSILASRFVSAKSHDISHLEPEKEVIKEKDPKDDPKVAARMKLFGKLTHRVMEWHPDKLVCKRFNIPHPYPDSKFVGVKGDPSAWGKASSATSNDTNVPSAALQVEIPKKKGLFDNLDFSKPPPGLLPPEAAASASFQTKPTESSGEADVNVTAVQNSAPVLAFHKEITTSSSTDSTTVEKIDTAERPPLDLFKEIFADSSESESEQVEEVLPTGLQMSLEKGKVREQASHHLVSQHMRIEKAAARDDKPLDKRDSSNDEKSSLPLENESVNQQKEIRRRGIFDRIDLDRLQDNAYRLHRSGGGKSPQHHRSNSSGSNSDGTEEEIYGPTPPKPASTTTTSRQHPSGSSLSTRSISSLPASSTSSYTRSKSTFDDTKKEVNTEEEVIWVEKSAFSDGSGSRSRAKKSKKNSSKEKHRKSNKKEKRKKSKQKHKHKKKSHSSKSKQKSKSKQESTDESDGGDSSDSDASSDSSITINDSLDNRALLAKLKQITRSN